MRTKKKMLSWLLIFSMIMTTLLPGASVFAEDQVEPDSVKAVVEEEEKENVKEDLEVMENPVVEAEEENIQEPDTTEIETETETDSAKMEEAEKVSEKPALMAVPSAQGEDISSKIITELKIVETPEGTTDVSGQIFDSGKYLYVHCEFDEGSGRQIHNGDTVRVTWPGNEQENPEGNNCYLARGTVREKFIDGDGDELGEIVYSYNEARIRFNQRASEKLDVKGNFTFKVRAVNSKDDTIGSVTVKAGAKEKRINVHRRKGGTRGQFWHKMTGPLDNLDNGIIWDLAVDGSYNEVTEDVVITDTIADGHIYAGGESVLMCRENKETGNFEYHYMDSLANYNRGKNDNQKISIEGNGQTVKIIIPKEAFKDEMCTYGYTCIVARYVTRATDAAKESEQKNFKNTAYITTKYRDDSQKIQILTNEESSHTAKLMVDHAQGISAGRPGELKVFKYVIGAKSGKKDRPLEGVSFDVYKESGEKAGSFTTQKDGTGSLTSLRTGKYKLVETGAPDWIKFDEKNPKIIEDIEVSADTENEVITVGNPVKDEKFTLNIEKKWIGTPKERALFRLYADGKYKEFRTVTGDNNWKCSFENLPKYRADFKEGRREIKYTVKEASQQGVEQTSVEGSIQEGKMIFTNTRLTPIWVYKKWEGPKTGQVTVKLLKDGKDTGKRITLSDSNQWQDGFRGIPEADLDRYSVEEVKNCAYESTVERSSKDKNQFLITNTYKWPVKINKFDEISGNTIQLEDAILEIAGESLDKTISVKPGDIVKLLPGTYKLAETKVPKGYKKANVIEFTLEKDGTITQKEAENTIQKILSRLGKKENAENVKEVTMYDTPETKNIKVSKVWDDEDNRDNKRPKKLKITLNANGEKLKDVTLKSDNNWKYEFKNLPVAKDGSLIDYDVTEEAVKDYTSGKKETGGSFEFTNTYKPGKTSVSVTKEWDDKDNQDGLRPESIKVQLMANGKPYGNEVELKKGAWSYTWDNLPLNENGNPIMYEVREEENISNYTLKAISGNATKGFRIVNQHIPAVVSVSGTKTWNDNNNQNRPDAKFVLKADGTEIKEMKGKTDYAFNDLPKYKAGTEIVYTVEERAVNGYRSEMTKTEKGFNFTNTRTGTTKVDVKKIWKDPEGTTHPEVTVNLLANGDFKESIKLSDEKGWEHTFENLEKYDKNGKEIVYTVKEEKLENYKTVLTGTAEDGFTITNTITGKKEIPVRKIWRDPESTTHPTVTVELFDVTDQDLSNPDLIYKDPIKKLELNESNGFTGKFVSLDRYTEDGQEKLYGIHEEPLEGYWEPEYRYGNIDGKDGMEIVNTINGVVNFTLKKEWDGPKKDATILLHGTSGKKTDDTYDVDFTYEYELNAENQYTLACWVYKYDYLGREIHYTLSEKAIENYELTDIVSQNDTETSEDGKSIKLTDDDTVTFKNKNTETVDIPVEKIWKDEEKSHQDVTVKLLANEEEEGEKTLTLSESTGLKGEFQNLPKYDQDGKAIDYTVKENPVEGYHSTITGNMNSGYRITNSKNIILGINKKWIGEPARTEVEVGVYKTGENCLAKDKSGHEMKAFLINGLIARFTLEETDPDAINQYEVREITKPADNENWKLQEIKRNGNTFIVINKNTETTSLTVQKVWKDPEGTKHPEIEIELLADGKSEKTKDKVKIIDGTTTHTFSDLPKYDSKDGHEIKYSAREVKVPEGYTGKKTVDPDGKVIITNTKTGKRTFKVKKKWLGPAAGSVEVQLYKKVKGEDKPVKDDNGYAYKETLNHHSKWAATFPEVDRYDSEGQEITYQLKESMPEGTEDKYNAATVLNGDTFTVTNTNKETVNVPIEKKWNGTKTTASFKLYADGELYKDEKRNEKAIVMKDNDTGEAEFSDLPKYRKDGKLIDYTVKEDPVSGYRSEVKEKDGKFIFTNTEVTSVTVTKKWDGPASVAKIRLYADKEPTDRTCTLTKDKKSYTFKDLDKYQKDNKTKVIYTVDEEGCENYDHEITGDAENGFNITNTWLCPFKVNKFENGEDKNLSGVELKLYKGTGKDKTFYKDINQGELYRIPKGSYTLVEAKCPAGYKKAADIEFSISGKDGIVINNKFSISDKGKVTCGEAVTGMAYHLNKAGTESQKDCSIKRATKDTIWKACSNPRWNKEEGSDDYKKDMQRKSVIQVIEAGYPNNVLHIQEMNNLTDEEFKEVTQDALWYYTSTYNVQKEKIDREKYTVDQQKAFKALTSMPEDVDAAINVYLYTSEESKFISTSVAEMKSLSMFDEPEKITVKGHKIWDDKFNQDGLRPEEITVNLLANGRKVDSKKVAESDEWKCEFKVPGYHNGKKIDYTVTESAVKNYNTEITGDVENGFEVKNSYTPEKTSLTVTKVWNDNNNQDGLRPETLTIKLLADGEETDRTVTLKEGDQWSGIFENLDMYKDGKKINYSVTEDQVEAYEKPVVSGDMVNGFTIINAHTPERTRLSYEKIWKDNNNQDGIRPEKLHISLNAAVDGNANVVDVATVTNKNLTGEFKNLPVYENGKKITYEITEESVNGYTSECQTEEGKYTFTNSHQPETISYEGLKYWEDESDKDGFRPESVTIGLLANGEKVKGREVVVTADTGWRYSFENLPKFRDGKEIEYAPVEENVPKHYKTRTAGTTVFNTHVVNRLSVGGQKIWKDDENRDGIRPDAIKIKLLGKVNDEVTVEAETVVNAAGNWSYAFTDLPEYIEGEKVIYKLTEPEIPEGYTSEVEKITFDDKFSAKADITNTHKVEKITLEGQKIWNDDENRDGVRPEKITVNLLAGGEKIASKEVTEENNWKYGFRNLNKFRDGEEIKYTVSEEAVPDYMPEYAEEGINIKNSYTPGRISLSVNKEWKDQDNQDGIRPESVKVQLYANNNKKGKPVKLHKDNNWTYTFKNLFIKENGKEIEYTVKEIGVPKTYKSEIKKNLTENKKIAGFTITNTHKTEKTKVEGKKVWDDKFNQDGLRPESVKVQLYADGEKVKDAVKTVSEASGWKYVFEELDKFNRGKEIVYTVKEEEIPKGYKAAVDDFVITNTHETEKIKVSGEKIWKDKENQDGLRPEVITISLRENGKKINSTEVRPNKNGRWTYEFKDLPKFKNGKEITYTVEETKVPKGYKAAVDDFVIRNTHETEKIQVSGEKIWKDQENQDGLRPASVKVQLYADGEKVKDAVKTVSEASGWKYVFEDLDKFNHGKEIVYTVKEEEIPKGYKAAVDGFTITNTHETEKIQVSGEKIWKDNNNQDGLRPDVITISLRENGKKIKSAEVRPNKNGRWTYEFKDLPKFKNGKEITYTVEETKVPKGYKASVDGFTITNTHILKKEGGKPISRKGSPKTGDGALPGLYGALMLLAGMGFRFGKKKRDEDD